MKGVRGFCVDTGPMANYSIPFFETMDLHHCLSREFLPPGEKLQKWSAEWDPARLDAIVEQDSFEGFSKEIEEGPHLSLSFMLHGDASTRGAPLDPLFMLHHTNLDRLYWLWQQRQPQKRLEEYSGKRVSDDVLKSASVYDHLDFGDLGPSTTIGETLDTQHGQLCYSY